MCGIVGFTGKNQAAPILLDGLAKLEYRGYDSAGIVVRNGNDIEVVKAKGRLKTLIEKTDSGASVKGVCGIGHTRWATHGEPSEQNAHPHVSGDEKHPNVIAVHNGIIENYRELKEKLEHHGYIFYSQTDTEVFVKLVDYYYKKYKIGPIDALAKTMVRVRGSYALAVMFNDFPGEIYVARKDSPMVLGIKDGESYIASDVPALLKHTRNVYYINNMEMARVEAGKITFYDLNGDIVEHTLTKIKWDAQSAEKGGYEHFMIKEIHEQPKAIKDTLNSVVEENKINLTNIGLDDDFIRSIEAINIVACGSAYHVGVAAQYAFESLCRIPVRVEIASEYRYRNPILTDKTLVIIVSQSGETADSLAALREAKARGAMTLGIVNVIGSSIAREADKVFYTLAGPEIAVATTKAYSAQLTATYLLATHFAHIRQTIDTQRYTSLIEEIKSLPEKAEQILEQCEKIQFFAQKAAAQKDIFFLGRGMDYATALEASLKMKEISYIHSEAYAAGELKHGTISLIEEGTIVVSILTQSHLYEKMVSNMTEVKSRGAYLFSVTLYGNYNIESVSDYNIYVPKTEEVFSTILAIIPLQLLGYYVSVARGLDVDKPRNLAKSVTVE